MRIRWPWDRATEAARAHAADAAQYAALAAESHRKALQCALAAGEAVAATRGAGDRWRGVVDNDLETFLTD